MGEPRSSSIFPATNAFGFPFRWREADIGRSRFLILFRERRDSVAMFQVVVNMSAVADALDAGASVLGALSLPDNAPPAFCLDSRRRVGDAVSPGPGVFDNRSISLPADFPSANLLQSEGVNSATVVLTGKAAPARDLCHTLRRWQEAGIELSLLRIDAEDPPQPLIVRRPPMFGQLWYGFLAALGLRPNLLGGYGGYLPEPSAG